MALNPIGDSNLPITQQELQSYAKDHSLTFVKAFLKTLHTTSQDQIQKPSSSFWKRIFNPPSKEQSLKGQLLAISQTGAANITIPGLKKSASHAEKTEALKRHSFKLLADLNESLGGELGNLQANVARAQAKVDLISSNPNWNKVDNKLKSAQRDLRKAKVTLINYQKRELESKIADLTVILKDTQKDISENGESPERIQKLNTTLELLDKGKKALQIFKTPSPSLLQSSSKQNNSSQTNSPSSLRTFQKTQLPPIPEENEDEDDASSELKRESFEDKTFDFTLLDREIKSIDLKINTLTERLQAASAEQKTVIQKDLEEELANKIAKLATTFEISSSPQKEERQTMLEKTIDELDNLNPEKANRKRFLYNLEPKRYTLPSTSTKSSQAERPKHRDQLQTPVKSFRTVTPDPSSSSKATSSDIELTNRKTPSPETTGESDSES